MTLVKSFNASAELREAAIASISNQESLSGSASHTLLEQEAWADRFGLPYAYFHLIAALGDPPLHSGPTSFRAQALSELPVGIDAREIVRRWFIWVHDASSAPLKATLAETPVSALAMRILDLHGQSATGSVSRAEWRDARKGLHTSAKLLPAEAQAWAAVVEAMAWDMESTPGVVADVVVACDELVLYRSDREVGWTEECADEFQRLQMECITAAAASLGFKPNNVPPDRRQHVRTKFEHLWNDAGHRSLSDAFDRRSSAMNNARNAWRSAAREGLLTITRAMTPSRNDVSPPNR
ncbi:MAG TPA: hypothetical protein VF463_18150 [Sphingobium sp.]